MNNRLKLFDGRNIADLNTGAIKSIDLPQYPDEAWNWLSGGPDAMVPGLRDYYKAIPFLFRGVDMRANRVSSMPFGIFRGETEIDSSADYQNVVKFLPNPTRLFKMIEMSLTLLGKSYLFNVRNEAVTKDLKYLNPTTVEPVIKDPEGLIGFKRQSTKRTHDLAVEDIIYFWPGDPWVELGPPTASPGTAALMASGVLANVDEFIAAFFHRGAIKAMLFRAKGMPDADRKKFLAWWDRFVTGVRNAFMTRILNAESMEPIVVGEGIEGLQDQDLNNEKQKDIATAIGVPQSMLFSNAANRATAQVDLFNFYDSTITPEVEFIFSILNEQVFEPMGLRIKDKHESLDVYQKDEQVRSTAYVQYTSAGIPLVFAFEMLGLEVPEGHTLDELQEADEQKQAAREAAATMPSAQEPEESKEEREQTEGKSLNAEAEQLVDSYMREHPVAITPEARADLAKWERKALRRLKEGKVMSFGFGSDYVPEDTLELIYWHLQSATTTEEIKAVFTNITEMPEAAHEVSNMTDLSELTRVMIDATKALRETASTEPPVPPQQVSHIHIPDTYTLKQAAPDITVEVAAPDVTVQNEVIVPEQPTPEVTVNVEAPEVTVVVPEPKPRTTTVERDVAGNITELTTE